MKSEEQQIWGYWQALMRLLLGKRVLLSYLDIPLEDAVQRAKYSVAWSTFLVGVGLLTLKFSAIHQTLTIKYGLVHSWPYVLCLLALVGIAILSTVFYGFFRLYTLVAHVMTINIFKTRGQRLRLLNIETTLLSLTAPLAVSIAVYTVAPWVSNLIIAATSLYLIYLASVAYSVIFHKTGPQGMRLFIGSTLVTWFVLGIGALAITVAFSVIAFFILLILRLVERR